MKKIITSVFVIALAAGATWAGTSAFFSDVETSTGNILQAGSIDLQVGNTSYYNGEESEGTTWTLGNLTGQVFFNFLDLKPGDEGEDTIELQVTSNPAWACADVDITANNENDIVDPEADDGDTTEDEGELAQFLNFVFWVDDGNNVLEDDEVILTQGPADAVLGGVTWPIFDSATNNGAQMQPDTPYYIGKAWCFGELGLDPLEAGTGQDPTVASGITCNGENVDNTSQTDSLEGTIAFRAVQVRNNEQFVCERPEQEEVLVGAALGSYSAPSSCDITVANGESIQGAIDNAGTENGDTVCVADSYDGNGDDTAIRINKDNVKLMALTQGTLLDVPVVLDNDGTQVSGFTGTSGQAESPSEVAAFYIDGDADNVVISYNSVNGGTNGVLTETSSTLTGALITNNVFQNLIRGIFFNPSQNMVAEYNDFINNNVGVANDEPHDNIIRYNEFSGNSESVGYLDEANAGIANNGLLDVIFNNILDGEVNNYGTTALDATNNWWGVGGSGDQVNAGAGSGTINTVPEAGSAYPQN